MSYAAIEIFAWFLIGYGVLTAAAIIAGSALGVSFVSPRAPPPPIPSKENRSE